MMRQAPAEPYDTVVNTSSCLTFFFFDTGRLVLLFTVYTNMSKSFFLIQVDWCYFLLYIPICSRREFFLTPFLWNNITYAEGCTYIQQFTWRAHTVIVYT